MITLILIISLCFGRIYSQHQITLSNPVLNIVETATTDTQIGNIQTTKSPCSIKSTKPTKGPFELKGSGTSYDVIYKYGRGYTKLDYSKTPTYILQIKCGSAQEDLEVDVHPNSPPTITDWPSVTLTNIKAKETAKDDVIYKVPASDTVSDTLTYTMYSDPDLGYFNIDKTSGEITAAVDLKLATVDVIPLKVNVSDGKNTVGPFSIFVRLKDLNSRPVFTNLPTNVSIKEDAVAGDTVLQLTYKDDDLFDSANFEPVCSVFPNSENYKFDYETSTRKLKLAKVPDGDTLLDFETTQFYNITCKINDGFLDNQGDYINVYVENVNEEPIFNQQLYTCNLYESKAGVSTCDLPMTITEPEDQKFETTLLPGNNSERFTLTTDTNKLTFQTTYDIDNNVMPDQVMLTVAAIDSRGKTGTSKIQVNIRDVNDNAPDFGAVEPAYSIGADTSLGVLGSVVADDIDDGSNGEVTYSLTGGSAQALAYVNVLGNGEVRYSNQYDYSLAGQTHYLEVTAKDKGSPQKTSTTTIAVLFQTTTTTPVPPTNTPVIVLNNGGSSSNSQTSSSTSFLDDPTNIGLLAALLSLLALAGLAALLCCCCRGSNSASCLSGGQNKSSCDCFSSNKEVEEVYETREYRPRVKRVKRIVEEPEVIEEKPKHVVVEEFVEEPRMVSYTPSIVSYNNPEYVTEVVPYSGYDRGYYRY